MGMTDKDVRRGIAYEKRVAKRRNATHVGGPGREDYRRGSTKGEVKCTKQKVTKPTLKKIAKKGIREVVSKSGFTDPAIKYAQSRKNKIKLIHRTKEVKPKSKGGGRCR